MQTATKIPVRFLDSDGNEEVAVQRKPKALPHLTSLPMKYLNKRISQSFQPPSASFMAEGERRQLETGYED